jgi:hypothetical protein
MALHPIHEPLVVNVKSFERLTILLLLRTQNGNKEY